MYIIVEHFVCVYIYVCMIVCMYIILEYFESLD